MILLLISLSLSLSLFFSVLLFVCVLSIFLLPFFAALPYSGISFSWPFFYLDMSFVPSFSSLFLFSWLPLSLSLSSLSLKEFEGRAGQMH